MTHSSRAPIAISMGDAAGIGPEIVLKTLAKRDVMRDYPAFVIGDVSIMARDALRFGCQVNIRRIDHVDEHVPQVGVVDVLSVSELPTDLPYGSVSAAPGAAAYAAIRMGIDLAMKGQIGALCTAPIHKEALSAANVPFPGHTEMLAEFSGTDDYGMLLINPALRTILVTVHCSIVDAIKRLDVALELRIIRLAHRTLQQFGVAHPRIAVAGVNPHAGEGGLFGREDIDIIAPAVAQACAEGLDVVGPLPGDTVFMQARRGRYDIVVAQYHDQGLIPIKLLGVDDGVNITAGLPFVRTSPDHGTAFDIAGKGIADPASLQTALRTAHELAAHAKI
ncbi:MAG: 4-hydroxythreonine-4-phosphate dehydrogenase PdxA [Casimicrobium sp.]